MKLKLLILLFCLSGTVNAQDLANQYQQKQQREAAQQQQANSEHQSRTASADVIKQVAYTVSCSPNGGWGFYKGKVYYGSFKDPVDFAYPKFTYVKKGENITFKDDRRYYEINFRTGVMYWKMLISGELKDPIDCIVINGNTSNI